MSLGLVDEAVEDVVDLLPREKTISSKFRYFYEITVTTCWSYMEKNQVAAGGPFCGVRRRPKLLGKFFTQFTFVAAPIFGRLRSFVRRHLKNRITG